jgi:sigma-B regulation protein RsbU (phosphoserine phosphatase)
MRLYVSGTLAGRRQNWPLDGTLVEIGRSSKCVVQLADGTVSKVHAEITRAGDGWQIRDLGSRNGTKLNGVPLTDPRPIKAGDRLEIGQVPLEIITEADPTPTIFSEGLDLASSLRIPANRILSGAGGVAGGGMTPTAAGGKKDIIHLLAEAGQLLVLPRPLPETCDLILAVAERAVSATRLVLLLREDPKSEPVQMAARLRGGSATEPLALSRTIMEMVLTENTSVITRDAASDPRFKAQQSIVLGGVHSAMAVPLFDNERVLGLIYADSTDPRTFYGQEELEVLTLVANMAAVKITNARLLEAEESRRRMAQELATAAGIQRGLLPARPPERPGWRFHARLESCYEVGGDLFDFHTAPDGALCFVIGDVSGKGMGAALLMSSFISSSRVLFDLCPDPRDLVQRLNAVMFHSSDPAHFVTAFIGRLNTATGQLDYVNAGHPPPIVIGPAGSRQLDTTGIPVGMLDSFPYEVGRIDLEPGALVAVFTDGIPEARRGNDFYEDERLEAALAELAPNGDLDQIGPELIHRVDEFLAGEPRSDDITLVLIRREGTQPA